MEKIHQNPSVQFVTVKEIYKYGIEMQNQMNAETIVQHGESPTSSKSLSTCIRLQPIPGTHLSKFQFAEESSANDYDLSAIQILKRQSDFKALPPFQNECTRKEIAVTIPE